MTHISARGRWLPWVTPWVMAVMSGLLVFFAQMGPSTVGAGPALAAPTTTFGKASHVYDRATQQLSDTPGATNPQDRSSRSSAARAPWEIWVVRHKPVSSGAAEAGSGARFVVGAGGETTMFLRAGTESLEVTEHAALRMTQRGISIDAAESTLGQPSFQYFHQGVWKTGYYDPSSRIFIGTVDGRLTTVINNASPNYIANLQAATP